ncbi:MAG: PhoH family protein [Alphaproteobacteria bacterium]|nr:PhoH family protein [Alphaproteobacteria bacterium]
MQDADVKFTFGLGPAGTGKTYLAVAAALKRLEAGDVRSILLVRPALEAGQKIGFLPGSPEEKLAPYYIEIQNIFIEFLGKSKFNSLVNSGAIEFLQPGFIRGRTFKNSYVIVDEAQNFTYGEIKTVASRIGEGSVYCIMGDPDQTDLRPQHLSGLNDFAEAQKINPRNMVFTFMSAKGIERSPECRTIIENCAAYEKSREEQRTTAKPQMNGHDPAPV